jgi:hypothetical protein
MAVKTNTYLNNGGYVYVGGGSFATSANTDFDNVFSATYDQYRAVINLTAVSSSNVLYLRFINTAGSVDTTLNYDWQLLEYYQTTITASQSMADNGFRIGYAYTTPGFASITLDFFNPYAANRTNIMVQQMSPNGTTFVLGDDTKGHYRATTQFRGFRLLATGGATVTGTCQIMGVRKA